MADSSAPQRATLAAVARLAGVSPSTASLAFNDSGPVAAETKARVFAAAAELGYAGPDPRARSLRRGRSGIVGAVVENTLRDAFRDPINIVMLDGIADVAGPAGNSLLLLTETGGSARGGAATGDPATGGPATRGSAPSEQGGASLTGAPVDAVVLFGCSTNVDAAVAIVQRRGIPVVSIEGHPLDGVVDVGLDNRIASGTLARHLQGLGHRDVAVVTLELDRRREVGLAGDERIAAATAFTAAERIAGARDVFPDARVWATLGSTFDEGVRAGRALLEGPDRARPRPTAIIAQSDLLAAGVIRAALDLGLRVPDDVSVVGFDGIRLDDPAAADLTTMVQPAFEKGRAAGRAVLDLLSGIVPESVSFTSELRRGSTTAPPRA